jgi:CrcB protein
MIVVAFVLLAAAGALARWQLARLNRIDWAGGTLFANVGAAFVLGLLHGSSTNTLIMVGVGFLGSYSTFSSVMIQVIEGVRLASIQRAGIYLGTTLALGIAAAYAGLQIG